MRSFKLKLRQLILSIIFVSFSFPSLGCEVLRDKGLDFSQVMTLKKAFVYGKETNLSYSLAAIAWKESAGGKYKLNLQDPSAGVFHINIKNAIKYLDVKDTNFNRNRVAQMLVDDFYLSAEFATINLKFWQEKWGDDWNNIWASYNAGYNVGAGKKYSDDIKKKISIISKCGWT